jgi:uncharacterized protein YndB with AHSA1/START domain
VLVALRVPADPVVAFQAFTEEIGSWWRPSGLFPFSLGRSGTLDLEGGVGGRLVERYDDGTLVEIGRIRLWEPPHRLALSWRQAGFEPDQTTDVEVRFDDVGGDRRSETRVTVEHRGWDGIPQASAARHGMALPVIQRRLAEWWQAQLDALAGGVPRHAPGDPHGKAR